MKTMLWSPWLSAEEEIRSAMEKFDRLFGEERMMPRPAVDAHTEDGTLIVEVELPGVDIENDVTIEVIDDILTVSGKTEHDREYDRDGFHVAERRFGSFHRQIPLPDGVDPDDIEAAYTAGVLTVRVPLPAVEVSEPKKIPVKHD
ncbi:MAG: Hsp20/alpha crystallin family protein [Acidimicrobiia bacterium]|nr:Hsp20/alpha crystallin family protein [Acidimicrobiia bacterium]